VISYQFVKFVKKQSMYFSTTLRWFLVHFSVNILIGILSLPGMVQFLRDPYLAFDNDGKEEFLFSATSKWPFTVCNV
tara:strand:+ start:454 stop:684 length:231 start_codon:yes stop_codon:yes gene_type:complete